jgi:DNA-binding transcriptional ArsR family regulator
LLRVHLSADDVSRVRFAPDPAPLVEVSLAVAEARRQAPRATGARNGLPDAARPLLDLIPETGRGPLFVDPVSEDLDEGIELVRRSATTVVRSDLTHVWPSWRERPAAWVRDLADGHRDTWDILEMAQRTYFASCLLPRWRELKRTFQADVAQRLISLLQGGISCVLDQLHPDLRWRQGCIERIDRASTDIRLDGRGLLLVPCVSWTGRPLFALQPSGARPHALVYAARPAAGLLPGHGPGSPITRARLARLLGKNRAEALQALSEPCGTGELARRLGISAASASEHTRALRDARLITTRRDGRGVWHALTRLGAQLLDPSSRD